MTHSWPWLTIVLSVIAPLSVVHAQIRLPERLPSTLSASPDRPVKPGAGAQPAQASPEKLPAIGTWKIKDASFKGLDLKDVPTATPAHVAVMAAKGELNGSFYFDAHPALYLKDGSFKPLGTTESKEIKFQGS